MRLVKSVNYKLIGDEEAEVIAEPIVRNGITKRK